MPLLSYGRALAWHAARDPERVAIFERLAEPLRDDAGKVRRSALRDARLGQVPG